MSNERFTEGPWRWEKDELGYVEGLEPAVLSSGSEGMINVWNKYDEALIETAPELYAMAARCKDYIERYTIGDSASASMIAEIEALLYKARGE